MNGRLLTPPRPLAVNARLRSRGTTPRGDALKFQSSLIREPGPRSRTTRQALRPPIGEVTFPWADPESNLAPCQ